MTSLSSLTTARVRRFARHYLQMVIAMLAGMLLLGVGAAAALELAGSGLSELKEAAPAAYLLGMGASMTVPMVAWMRHRGHGWRPASEMGASMMVPTIVAAGLLGGGAIDFGGGMLIEHVAMFPAMLAVMLARRDEYSAPHAARRRSSRSAPRDARRRAPRVQGGDMSRRGRRFRGLRSGA